MESSFKLILILTTLNTHFLQVFINWNKILLINKNNSFLFTNYYLVKENIVVFYKPITVHFVVLTLIISTVLLTILKQTNP